VRNMANGVWRGSHTVLLMLHKRELMTDADQQAQIEALSRVLDDRAGHPSLRLLAISDGGAPTAAQRAELLRFLREREAPEIPWVLVTSSRFARSVASVVAASVPGDYRTYEPSDLRRAAEHLGVGDGEHADLWRAIRELDQGMGLEAVAEIAAERGG